MSERLRELLDESFAADTVRDYATAPRTAVPSMSRASTELRKLRSSIYQQERQGGASHEEAAQAAKDRTEGYVAESQRDDPGVIESFIRALSPQVTAASEDTTPEQLAAAKEKSRSMIPETVFPALRALDPFGLVSTGWEGQAKEIAAGPERIGRIGGELIRGRPLQALGEAFRPEQAEPGILRETPAQALLRVVGGAAPAVIQEGVIGGALRPLGIAADPEQVGLKVDVSERNPLSTYLIRSAERIEKQVGLVEELPAAVAYHGGSETAQDIAWWVGLAGEVLLPWESKALAPARAAQRGRKAVKAVDAVPTLAKMAGVERTQAFVAGMANRHLPLYDRLVRPIADVMHAAKNPEEVAKSLPPDILREADSIVRERFADHYSLEDLIRGPTESRARKPSGKQDSLGDAPPRVPRDFPDAAKKAADRFSYWNGLTGYDHRAARGLQAKMLDDANKNDGWSAVTWDKDGNIEYGHKAANQKYAIVDRFTGKVKAEGDLETMFEVYYDRARHGEEIIYDGYRRVATWRKRDASKGRNARSLVMHYHESRWEEQKWFRDVWSADKGGVQGANDRVLFKETKMTGKEFDPSLGHGKVPEYDKTMMDAFVDSQIFNRPPNPAPLPALSVHQKAAYDIMVEAFRMRARAMHGSDKLYSLPNGALVTKGERSRILANTKARYEDKVGKLQDEIDDSNRTALQKLGLEVGVTVDKGTEAEKRAVFNGLLELEHGPTARSQYAARESSPASRKVLRAVLTAVGAGPGGRMQHWADKVINVPRAFMTPEAEAAFDRIAREVADASDSFHREFRAWEAGELELTGPNGKPIPAPTAKELAAGYDTVKPTMALVRKHLPAREPELDVFAEVHGLLGSKIPGEALLDDYAALFDRLAKDASWKERVPQLRVTVRPEWDDLKKLRIYEGALERYKKLSEADYRRVIQHWLESFYPERWSSDMVERVTDYMNERENYTLIYRRMILEGKGFEDPTVRKFVEKVLPQTGKSHYKNKLDVKEALVNRQASAPPTQEASVGVRGPAGAGQQTTEEFAETIGRLKDGKLIAQHLGKRVNLPGSVGRTVAQRKLMLRIANFVEGVEVRVVKPGEASPLRPSNLGIYVAKPSRLQKRGEKDIIYLSAGKGVNSETVAHELIHAATTRRLADGKLFANENTDLHRAAKDLIILSKRLAMEYRKNPKGYALQGNEFESDHEILAWGLTNQKFQDWLSTVKVPGVGPKGRQQRRQQSGWSAFVDTIRRILGFSPKDHNALSELLRITDDILEADVSKLSRRDYAPRFNEMRAAPPDPKPRRATAQELETNLRFALRIRSEGKALAAMEALVEEAMVLPSRALRKQVADILLEGEELTPDVSVVDKDGRRHFKYSVHAYQYADSIRRKLGIQQGQATKMSSLRVEGKEFHMPELLRDEVERAKRLGYAGRGADLFKEGSIFNWMYRAQKQGITYGLLLPTMAYHMGNVLSIPFTSSVTMGLGETARSGGIMARHPLIVAALTKRASRYEFSGRALRRKLPHPSVFPENNVASSTFATDHGVTYSVDELDEMMRNYNVDQSYAAHETGKALLREMEQAERGWKSLRNIVGEWQQAILEAASATEQSFRIATFLSHLKAGTAPEVAAKAAREVLFDYSTLTDFERFQVRKGILFYSFMRKNADAVIKASFDHPERVGQQMRFFEEQQNAWGRDDEQQMQMQGDDLGRLIVGQWGREIDANGEFNPQYTAMAATTTPIGNVEALFLFQDMFQAAAGLLAGGALRMSGTDQEVERERRKAMARLAGQTNPAFALFMDAAYGVNIGTGWRTNTERANEVPAWMMELPGLGPVFQSMFNAVPRQDRETVKHARAQGARDAGSPTHWVSQEEGGGRARYRIFRHTLRRAIGDTWGRWYNLTTGEPSKPGMTPEEQMLYTIFGAGVYELESGAERRAEIEDQIIRDLKLKRRNVRQREASP